LRAQCYDYSSSFNSHHLIVAQGEVTNMAGKKISNPISAMFLHPSSYPHACGRNESFKSRLNK
jgi:hypothetical protein